MNITTIFAWLKSLYAQLFVMQNTPTAENAKITKWALSFIGFDASPKDLVPDSVGCAESVSNVLHAVYPSFPIITGTYTLYAYLKDANEFVKVTSPLAGDIIISPTGLGGTTSVPEGHTGIVGENSSIMSNNSLTGKWDNRFTLTTWNNRYVTLGRFPVYFYRRILP